MDPITLGLLLGGAQMGLGAWQGSQNAKREAESQRLNLLKDAAEAEGSGWFRQPFRSTVDMKAPRSGTEAGIMGGLQGAMGGFQSYQGMQQAQKQNELNQAIIDAWKGVKPPTQVGPSQTQSPAEFWSGSSYQPTQSTYPSSWNVMGSGQ